MTGKPTAGGDNDGPLGDDLLDELDNWDKMFDQLHEAPPPAPPEVEPAAAAPPAAEPEPEPERPAPEPGPFPVNPDEVQLDGEPRALGALLGARSKRATAPGEEPEEGLYTSAPRPAITLPPLVTGKPVAASRKAPAIIRREKTTRPGMKVSPEIEEIARGRSEPAEAAAVERMAESADALFRSAPPEVDLNVDEDFYDDIEVAAQAGQTTAPSTASPAAARDDSPLPGQLPSADAAARRTTRHIVRREAGQAPTPRSKRATAQAPQAGELAPQAGELAPQAGEIDVPERPDAEFSDFEDEPSSVELTGTDLLGAEDAPAVPIIAPEPEPASESEPTPVPAAAPRPEPAPVVPARVASAPKARAASEADLDVDFAIDDSELVEEAVRVREREDGEVDAALDDAVAMSDGTLQVAQVADVDVAPDLPPARFPAVEPTVDVTAIMVADVDPVAEDRTEDMARDLLLYERELLLMDDAGPTARLRMEAGRLAERLGDLDRARSHYDGALQLDPRLRPPLRALRRVERALGNFGEAVRHLDAEIELSSDMERRALAAYRADLLMAIGEQDLARVAVGDLLDDAPGDVRSLLANLELAWVDGRNAELESTLDRLAQAVADEKLSAALARARAALAEATGGDGAPALRAALLREPTDRLAWLGLAHAAAARGDDAGAAEALAGLVREAGLAQVAAELTGAIEWRRAQLLGRAGGNEEAASAAIERAAYLLPEDPALIEARAHLLVTRGEDASAAIELERLAVALPGADWAGRQAAQLLEKAGDTAGAIAALRRALERDPGDALAATHLASLLEAAGEQEALCELDRRFIAGDSDTVLPRVRLARRLERLGRVDQAIAVLAEGRAIGLRSAALDAQLARVYQRTGGMAELAELSAAQVREKISYVSAAVAERHTAAALEAIATGRQMTAPTTLDGGTWDDRSSTGLLEGDLRETTPRPLPSDLEHDIDLGDGDGVPEPVFAAPSGRIREGSGPSTGTWREPGPVLGPLAMSRDPARAEEGALAAWRRVLELDPDSAPARAGAWRLAAGRTRAERIVVLALIQKSAAQPAAAVEIALRRAELMVADHDRQGAEAVLRAAAVLAPDDPRCHLALLRLLAEDLRWDEAADLLVERADEAGDRDEAVSLRYRAAGLLFDKADDARRAADLLTSIVAAHPDFMVAQDLLRAAKRRLGDVSPAADAATATPSAAPRPGVDDAFVRLMREAEQLEAQVGDAGRIVELYQQALALKPDDPLVRDSFARAAVHAGETSPLAELALGDLRRAEAHADGVAKATAYEELARIDAELRGDLNSATLAWESAVESDPARVSAFRHLERAYLTSSRDRELLRLYERFLVALDGPRDQLVVLGEETRLAERVGRPRDEVLDAFRRMIEIDPKQRMALFRLEAAARSEGSSLALADLERAVARFFSGDARAEAAFLTRAGETLRSVGDREGAIASFRTAVASLPGYAPALSGWRDAAVSGEMWLDVADVAEREAESASTDGERIRLYHLAGVVLMDRGLSSERAIGTLRRVLAVDPAHRDAFLRLKSLYEEAGRDLELVELYRARLDVEKEPAMQVKLHQGLAALYRKFFDDREAARDHLQSALAIEPDNLSVVADLSDVAWELGDWSAAAEALILRAKMETRPDFLRTIFYRLGTIYADRLPDPRYAMMSFQKVLTYDPTDIGALTRVADLAMDAGDFRLALGACEQLIKQMPTDPEKVPHLHRVARIYQEGVKDRQRAERAYRLALDLDPTSEDALAALIVFYRDAGDAQSARVHLDRVATSMRQHVLVDPLLLRPYQVLARALEERDHAGVPGSLATARCAAEIAVTLGSNDARDAELAIASSRARTSLAALSSPEIDDLVFPPLASSSLRQLFRMLGERLAKHVGLDVRRYGVGRGERLRKGSDPIAGMILEMGAEMGFDDIDIYLSPKQPTVIAVEPTSPISLVLGSQLATLDRPAELRFLVGRALKLTQASLAVPARMSPDELGVLMGGLFRQFASDFEPRGLDPQLVVAEQQKLRRLIPSQMLQELAPYALGVMNEFDHRALWLAIIDGGNRAGLLAAGTVSAALSTVLRLGGYRDIHQGGRDPLVTGLLRFAVSEDHAVLRAQLGG